MSIEASVEVKARGGGALWRSRAVRHEAARLCVLGAYLLHFRAARYPHAAFDALVAPDGHCVLCARQL
jgi:hypothetical protein